MRLTVIVLIAVIATMIAPTGAAAQQSDYGIRIPSRDGRCLAPVASRLIGSNENDHTNRRSPTLAWDWSAAVGSPVFPICPGVVREASSSNRGGYGWFVVIDHGGGISSLYAHCMQNSFRVKAGDQVDHWTQICSVGMTGMTSWAHIHLNIDKNGVHQPISNYFDPELTHYCHFTRCLPRNKPDDPIIRDSQQWTTQSQQQPQQQSMNRLMALLQVVAQTPANQVGSVVFVVTMGIGLLLWLGGMWIRVAIVGLGSGLGGAVTVALLLMPVAPMQANQQAPAVGGDIWEAAYSQMRKWEGARCVHDPVRTFKGITNGTYNAWRQSKGLGAGDVCTSLTEQQAEAIYFERYWLASGASQITSKALAITHFDMAVNAGVGAAKKILSQCGNDATCYNNAREQFYKSSRDCYRYCAGWLNRLNDIRKITQLMY